MRCARSTRRPTPSARADWAWQAGQAANSLAGRGARHASHRPPCAQEMHMKLPQRSAAADAREVQLVRRHLQRQDGPLQQRRHCCVHRHRQRGGAWADSGPGPVELRASTRVHAPTVRPAFLGILPGLLFVACGSPGAADAGLLSDGGQHQGGVVSDFALPDVNPASPSFQRNVSPRDYLGKVSAWYFGHSS